MNNLKKGAKVFMAFAAKRAIENSIWVLLLYL